VKRERGFTLIELMISLVVASLLVIMILSIFSRLSFSYKEQAQIVQIQQTLAAARAAFELDARQAGLEMSQGFKIAHDAPTYLLHSPIVQIDSSTGPDEIAFFYADPSTQAVVTSAGPATTITVDNATGFTTNQLVVLSTADTTTMVNPIDPTNDAKIATFDACVVQIQSIAGNSITFQTGGNWGVAGNAQCTNTAAGSTMMYGFVAHDWRLDPVRTTQGVLQMSPTGNLIPGLADFQDMAYDFTDIQTSIYFFDDDGIDTADPDTDGNRDWYSDNTQQTWTQPIALTSAFVPPIMMSISLVARNDRDVEGIFTAQTPNLTQTGNTANNMVGNHASVTLPSATDTRLQGNRIYRYITFQVDLRNMGVGR